MPSPRHGGSGAGMFGLPAAGSAGLAGLAGSAGLAGAGGPAAERTGPVMVTASSRLIAPSVRASTDILTAVCGSRLGLRDCQHHRDELPVAGLQAVPLAGRQSPLAHPARMA